MMGHIQLSENTIQRHRSNHDSNGSRAATIVTTLLTLVILVALGALVYNYVSNARPQVATSAHAPHSISDVQHTARASAQS